MELTVQVARQFEAATYVRCGEVGQKFVLRSLYSFRWMDDRYLRLSSAGWPNCNMWYLGRRI